MAWPKGKKRIITWGSKISAAKKGHSVSVETRKKISLSEIGKIPWNKGKRYKNPKTSLIQKGRRLSEEHKKNIGKASIRLGLKPPVLRGESNPKWKGNLVSYRSLHKWIEGQLGKPRDCSICKEKNLNHRQYHWANKSGLYKRELNDWLRLCVKCHKRFDKKINL